MPIHILPIQQHEIPIHIPPIQQHELVICGHSSDTIKTFPLPKNITIIFFADEHEQCIVPDTYVSLKSCISEIQGINKPENIFIGPTKCPNYNITFNSNTMLDGISIIDNSVFSNHHKNPFEPYYKTNNVISLKKCCDIIQDKFNETMFTIYCVFCRGSEADASHSRMSDVEHIGSTDLDFTKLGDFTLNFDGPDTTDHPNVNDEELNNDDIDIFSTFYEDDDSNASGLKKKRKPKNNKTKKKSKNPKLKNSNTH